MISVKKKGILFLAIFDKFESRKHTMNDYIKCVYFLSIRFFLIFVTNDLHYIILHLKKYHVHTPTLWKSIFMIQHH